MVEQAQLLGKMPHIIIATPGRLMDHLQNTKGFTLKKTLRYLVMDEADRILNMDFEKEVNQVRKQKMMKKRLLLVIYVRKSETTLVLRFMVALVIGNVSSDFPEDGSKGILDRRMPRSLISISLIIITYASLN